MSAAQALEIRKLKAELAVYRRNTGMVDESVSEPWRPKMEGLRRRILAMEDAAGIDRPPFKVGDVGFFKAIAIQNTVGGTRLLNGDQYSPWPGEARVEITRAWHDYETGWKAAGVLLDADLIEIARAAGTSIYDAEYYRRAYPDHPKLAESAQKAADRFRPEIVYVSQWDLRRLEGEG